MKLIDELKATRPLNEMQRLEAAISYLVDRLKQDAICNKITSSYNAEEFENTFNISRLDFWNIQHFFQKEGVQVYMWEAYLDQPRKIVFYWN